MSALLEVNEQFRELFDIPDPLPHNLTVRSLGGPALQRILRAWDGEGERPIRKLTLSGIPGRARLVGRILAEDGHDLPWHRVLRADGTCAPHIEQEQRFPVLAELTSAPGHALVFTRTRHRAKALTSQLNAQGIPAVELHGDLNQGARARNLAAFHAGRGGAPVAHDRPAGATFDVTLTRYRDGQPESRVLAHMSPDFTSLHWRG